MLFRSIESDVPSVGVYVSLDCKERLGAREAKIVHSDRAREATLARKNTVGRTATDPSMPATRSPSRIRRTCVTELPIVRCIWRVVETTLTCEERDSSLLL